ncbi:uncharacterized protein LOC127264812 [Andrographis paniculata]|uniref:uncharacterized protein LOC127264812 n=1 Tax=Andrographis paniculata TaxID=175694 RepID=UPI0021E77E12|nr:uncharacterized protein LOC127264812 [Andrographis paniculata]
MASNMLQFQQDTRNNIKSLEEQVSQIANEMREMKSKEKGKLLAWPDANPKNVSSMVLRSGKELEGPKIEISKDKDKEEIEREIEKAAHEKTNKVTSETPIYPKTNAASFPCRLKKPRKSDKNKEMMEMFRKVELSITLLDAIKKVLKYAKFFKELCTNKKRLRGDECIIARESVSVIIQCKLPLKCGDPGMFSVPCKIGKLEIKRVMLDLEVAINVMPTSINKSLNVGPLKEIRIMIQLDDRTNAYPEEMIEDVLLQVNELIFPVDFYVLDMHNDNSPNPSPILLGRPFMCTVQTKIDVKQGILSMEFDGEKVQFNISDAMKYPGESSVFYSLDVFYENMQEIFYLSGRDPLEIFLEYHRDVQFNAKKLMNSQLREAMHALQSSEFKTTRLEQATLPLSESKQKILPSVLQVPDLEMKSFPDKLKYVFL